MKTSPRFKLRITLYKPPERGGGGQSTQEACNAGGTKPEQQPPKQGGGGGSDHPPPKATCVPKGRSRPREAALPNPLRGPIAKSGREGAQSQPENWMKRGRVCLPKEGGGGAQEHYSMHPTSPYT